MLFWSKKRTVFGSFERFFWFKKKNRANSRMYIDIQRFVNKSPKSAVCYSWKGNSTKNKQNSAVLRLFLIELRIVHSNSIAIQAYRPYTAYIAMLYDGFAVNSLGWCHQPFSIVINHNQTKHNSGLNSLFRIKIHDIFYDFVLFFAVLTASPLTL